MNHAVSNSRTRMLSDIFSRFDSCAQAFCQDTAGLFCDLESRYKGPRQPQNLQEKRAKIYYHAFIIEFVYTAHGIMGVVNSILSCSLYPDKSEDTLGIPLPLVTDYCGTDIRDPLCIPFITSGEGMAQAFHCIGSAVKSLLPTVAETFRSPESTNEFRNLFHEELRRVFQIDLTGKETAAQRQWLSNFFIFRFSGGAFLTALQGNYSKAIKQLAKTKDLTGYEKRMQQLWQQRNLSAELPTIRKNARSFSGTGTSKMELKEILAGFVAWLVLLPGFSAVYLGLFALSVWIQSRNSVFLAGPQYTFPYCIFTGFITAIAFSWFARFFFYKLLFRKDFEQYREMESIQNLERLNKLMRSLAILVVSASMIFCLLASLWNINFTREGFTDNTAFLSLSGDFYRYEDVDCVSYKPDRINGLGDTIPSPSYVIVLQDGKEIDLIGYCSVDDVSGKLLPLLRELEVPIR